jgi:hypothetical protein
LIEFNAFEEDDEIFDAMLEDDKDDGKACWLGEE